MWKSDVRLGKMRGMLAGLPIMGTISAEKSNLFCAEVAQLAEHSPEKAGVDSSILSLGTTPLLLSLFQGLKQSTRRRVLLRC